MSNLTEENLRNWRSRGEHSLADAQAHFASFGRDNAFNTALELVRIWNQMFDEMIDEEKDDEKYDLVLSSSHAVFIGVMSGVATMLDLSPVGLFEGALEWTDLGLLDHPRPAISYPELVDVVAHKLTYLPKYPHDWWRPKAIKVEASKVALPKSLTYDELEDHFDKFGPMSHIEVVPEVIRIWDGFFESEISRTPAKANLFKAAYELIYINVMGGVSEMLGLPKEALRVVAKDWTDLGLICPMPGPITFEELQRRIHVYDGAR